MCAPICSILFRANAHLRGGQTFERTTTMAIKAKFFLTPGLLSVFDDNGDDTITISRDAAGKIFVNADPVSGEGGQPTVANPANTTVIEVFGQAGDDRITLDESNGPLPAA